MANKNNEVIGLEELSVYDALIKHYIDNKIDSSGGGGTTVIANPSEEATDDLIKIQIGNTVYGIVGGGGSGGGYTKELVYDSGSPTVGAPYNTDIPFIKPISGFDQLLFIVAAEGDGGIGVPLNANMIFADIKSLSEAKYYCVYFSRTVRLSEITNTTFNYYSVAGQSGDKLVSIFKIYGIKFGGGGSITIDENLSLTSTNAVQNKAITETFSSIVTGINPTLAIEDQGQQAIESHASEQYFYMKSSPGGYLLVAKALQSIEAGDSFVVNNNFVFINPLLTRINDNSSTTNDIDVENLYAVIPKMTSNNAPSGEVIDSRSVDTGWRVFDGDNSTSEIFSAYASHYELTSSSYIQYNFDNPTKVSGLTASLKIHNDYIDTDKVLIRVYGYNEEEEELFEIENSIIATNDAFNICTVNFRQSYTISQCIIRFINEDSREIECNDIQLYNIPEILQQTENLSKYDQYLHSESRNYIRNFKLVQNNSNNVTCIKNIDNTGYILNGQDNYSFINFTFEAPPGKYIFSLGSDITDRYNSPGFTIDNTYDISYDSSHGNNGSEQEVYLDLKMEPYTFQITTNSSFEFSDFVIKPMLRLATDSDSNYALPVKTNKELQFEKIIYSTDEQQIGLWNGEILYSKTITFYFSAQYGGTDTYDITINGLNSSEISNIWLHDGYIIDSNDKIPLNYYDGTNYIATKTSKDNSDVILSIKTNNASVWNNGYATVFYTK